MGVVKNALVPLQKPEILGVLVKTTISMNKISPTDISRHFQPHDFRKNYP